MKLPSWSAYLDITAPLYCDEDNDYSLDRRFDVHRGKLWGGETIYACIHSTCINAVFSTTGAAALLRDGRDRYFVRYKVPCTKRDKYYDGPLPKNPELNVMLPKCLRGTPEEGDDDEYGWSPGKAIK